MNNLNILTKKIKNNFLPIDCSIKLESPQSPVKQLKNKDSNNNNSTKFKLMKIENINYSHQFQEKRRDIYLEKKFQKKITFCYNLILYNKSKLEELAKSGQISKLANNILSFKLILDYFYNYILLFNLFHYINDQTNSNLTLQHLIEEKKSFILSKYVESLLKSKRTKFSKEIIEYIKFLSCFLQCTRKLGNNYLYEESLLSYVDFIEKLPENNLYIPYIYFYCGYILIELDYLKCSLISYELCYKYLNEYFRLLRASNILVITLYNIGLLSYVCEDDISSSIQYLNEAKRIQIKELTNTNKKKSFYNLEIENLGDIFNDDLLRQIYLTLIEVDYQNHNLDIVNEYVTFINKYLKYYSDHDKVKISYILGKLNSNDLSKLNTFNDEDFINYCLLKQNKNNNNQSSFIKDVDISEFQKFFLFFTTLSLYQVNLLNKEQPIINNIKKYKSLPIYFSDSFKQSLNFKQMEMLNELKTLNLKRGAILKNLTSKICLENLDLNFLDNNLKYIPNPVPMSSMNTLLSFQTKLNQYDNYLNIENNGPKDPQKKETPKNNITMVQGEANLEFAYQKKLPYEKIKSSLKKYVLSSSNNNPFKMEDLLKDNIVLGILNKMTFNEVNIIKDNPEWLIEILKEYQEKIIQEEESVSDKQENIVTEKDVVESNEKEEESYSENEANQDKSIDLIDAMGM